MKTILALLAIMAAVVVAALAADFPAAHINNTTSATLLSATTNATGTAVYVEMPIYHTIHISAPSNYTVITLDRSLDNSVWKPFSTNTLSSGAATVSEVTAIGKFGWIRATASGMTNSGTISIKYLGGK